MRLDSQGKGSLCFPLPVHSGHHKLSAAKQDKAVTQPSRAHRRMITTSKILELKEIQGELLIWWFSDWASQGSSISSSFPWSHPCGKWTGRETPPGVKRSSSIFMSFKHAISVFKYCLIKKILLPPPPKVWKQQICSNPSLYKWETWALERWITGNHKRRCQQQDKTWG